MRKVYVVKNLQLSTTLHAVVSSPEDDGGCSIIIYSEVLDLIWTASGIILFENEILIVRDRTKGDLHIYIFTIRRPEVAFC